MSFIAAAIGVGAVGTIGAAFIQSGAQKQAAQQQQQGLQQALGLQQRYFDAAQKGLQPFIQGGQSVGPTLQNLLMPGPNQNRLLSELPGFQFANYWGQQAARNQGTTMGLGGNTLMGAEQAATGLAQGYWGQDVNALQNFYGTGANAAGAFANTAQSFGQQGTAAATGIGQAAAAGTLGSANALAGGVAGLGNLPMNALLLNKFLSQPSTPSTNWAQPNPPIPFFGGR
jgi:hypothetical protein